jgi:hypothetical protein
MKTLLLSCSLLLPAIGFSQQYSVDWYKVSGGGGTSTGGVLTVSGTIGQPDAGTMSGSDYALVGGFWGIVAAVQAPGAPFLTITRSNIWVVVSWPLPAPGWRLHASTNVVAGSVWTGIPPPYQTNGANLQVIQPLPGGNKFYRLHRP